MRDTEVYDLVCEYIILHNIYNALLYDQRKVSTSILKLRRAYPSVIDEAVRRVANALQPVLRELHRSGCRILTERAAGKDHYYVMYRHKGFTEECKVEGRVLRTQCEDKLLELFGSKSVN